MTTPYTELSIKHIPGSIDANVDTISYIPISDAGIQHSSLASVLNIFKMLSVCTPIEASVIINSAVNFVLFDVKTAVAVLKNMPPIANSCFFLIFSNNARRVVNYVDVLTIANIILEFTNIQQFVGKEELRKFHDCYACRSFMSMKLVPKPHTTLASKYTIGLGATLITKQIKNLGEILRNLMALVAKELPGAKTLNVAAVAAKLTKHQIKMTKSITEANKVYHAEEIVPIKDEKIPMVKTTTAVIIKDKSELESAFMDAKKQGKDLKVRFASYKLLESMINENYRSLFIMGLMRALNVGIQFNWHQGINEGPAIILRRYESKEWKSYIICTGQFSPLKALKFCVTSTNNTSFNQKTQNIYYVDGVLSMYNSGTKKLTELTAKDLGATVVLLPESSFYDITYNAEYEALGISLDGHFIPIMKKVVDMKYEIIDEIHNLDYDKIRQMSEECSSREDIILKKINEAKNLELKIAEEMSKNRALFVTSIYDNAKSRDSIKDIVEVLNPIKVLFKVLRMFDVLEPSDGEGAIISASLGKIT